MTDRIKCTLQHCNVRGARQVIWFRLVIDTMDHLPWFLTAIDLSPAASLAVWQFGKSWCSQQRSLIFGLVLPSDLCWLALFKFSLLKNSYQCTHALQQQKGC